MTEILTRHPGADILLGRITLLTRGILITLWEGDSGQFTETIKKFIATLHKNIVCLVGSTLGAIGYLDSYFICDVPKKLLTRNARPTTQN